MTKIIAMFVLSFSLLASSSKQTPRTLTEALAEKSKLSSKMVPAPIKKEMNEFNQKLKKTNITKNAVQSGRKLPSFKINGVEVSKMYSKKPLIIKFYRGSWCPYCQIEMKYYQKYKSQIEAKGYQVIILTPDTEMEIKKFKDKRNITYDIYQDKNNDIAKKLGVAFRVDPNITGIYKKFGIDLDKSQGNTNKELPLPGTYVVNKRGEITYSFIDVDYTKRLDPIDLLKVL